MSLTIVALPIVGALLAGVVPRRLSGLAGVLAAALATAVVAWLALAQHRGAAEMIAAHWLPWIFEEPVFGVLLDPLAKVLILVVTPVGFLTALYSTSYLGQRNREHAVPVGDHGRYHFWLLLFVASMSGVAVSPNFLQLFFFWEMTTLCSWALISFYENEASLRAGFKALVMTHVGGLFFLTAVVLLYVKTGSFAFDALGRLSGPARTFALVCLFIAAWAKAAQVPFHTWLPGAMEAPTPVSAYLHAAAMVKAGVFLVARVAVAGTPFPPALAYVLGAMALATTLLALSFYFVQDDLKRLLAYSTIAHLGYVLLGVAIGVLGSPEGLRGGVLHIICHGFAKATLFFCVGSVAYITGSRSIASIQGLGRTMPLTATAFFIGVLAVTGVPPFACFWSKLMILTGAIRLSGWIGPVLVVLIVSETLVSFAWMLHVAQKVFLGAPSPAAQVNSEPPLPMSATVVLLMVGCLLAPAMGIPLVRMIGG